MKKCKICNELKPYTEFNKYSKTRDGYLNKCRACHRLYIESLNNGHRLTQEERYEVIRVSKHKAMIVEKEQSNELLKGIGYDIDSELSIHDQFLIRHNLI